MSWSLSLIFLAGIPAQQDLNTVEPHFTNYHRGHDLARESKKPLLVIMNNGPQTDKAAVSLVSVRKTSERRELLKDYVVVVIDTTTPHGKIVHKAYSTPKLPHVVVLDKKQGYILFTSSESLYGQRWTEVLKKHQKGERIVRTRTVPAQYCAT